MKNLLCAAPSELLMPEEILRSQKINTPVILVTGVKN